MILWDVGAVARCDSRAQRHRGSSLRSNSAAPAYDEADVRRFFSVLRRIDPRIALLLEIALGSRLGQACRITRKSLDLISDHVGAGKLTIPEGEEKKPGMVLDLSRRAVRAIRRAFATYLAIFEGAYPSGDIADYWLDPGGWPQDLKTPSALRNAECISEQFLGKLFDEAETSAGVEKMRKRRTHGLRRFVRTQVPDWSLTLVCSTA